MRKLMPLCGKIGRDSTFVFGHLVVDLVVRKQGRCIAACRRNGNEAGRTIAPLGFMYVTNAWMVVQGTESLNLYCLRGVHANGHSGT
jgi:hypothetical protein